MNSKNSCSDKERDSNEGGSSVNSKGCFITTNSILIQSDFYGK